MRILLSIFAVLLLLSGCSSKSSLELISSSVELSVDGSKGIGISSEKKEDGTILLVSLSYDFVLKNTGTKTIGKIGHSNNETHGDGLKVYIEPNNSLRAVTKKVMGFNMYNEKEGLGLARTNSPIIKPNQEGEYTFDFNLGALEENPAISLAPSQEQLDKLLKSAMDATLVVCIGEKEIARFDLAKSN